MKEIKYGSEEAMSDLIALARGVLDVINSAETEISITAIPGKDPHDSFVVMNVGNYTYKQFYAQKGELVDVENKKKVTVEEVKF